MKDGETAMNLVKFSDIKINLRFYVLSVIFLTPIIDIINGILGDVASVGKIVRTLIVFGNIIAIIYLSVKKKSKRNSIFYLFLIYFAVQFFVRFLFNREGFMLEISAYLKIILFISEIILLLDCLDTKLISKKDFDVFWKYTLLVIPISMFIAYVTSTGKNYGVAGNQGYFVSVNALMVTMIMQVNISVLFALQRKISWAVVFINLLAIFFIGTKTSYVFVAASLLLMLIYLFFKNKKYFKKLLTVGSVCLILLAIIVLLFFRDKVTSIFDYLLHFWNLSLESGNILNFLLSGRDELLGAAFQVMNGSGLKYLFGIGFYNLETGIADVFGLEGIRGIEMDPFEIWFSFGLPTLIYVYSFFFVAISKKSKFKVESFIINAVICLTLVYSALGGHALMESLGGTYCAILLAYKTSLTIEAK